MEEKTRSAPISSAVVLHERLLAYRHRRSSTVHFTIILTVVASALNASMLKRTHHPERRTKAYCRYSFTTTNEQIPTTRIRASNFDWLS